MASVALRRQLLACVRLSEASLGRMDAHRFDRPVVSKQVVELALLRPIQQTADPQLTGAHGPTAPDSIATRRGEWVGIEGAT